MILHRKLNPNLPGKDGWTPIEIAVQAGIVEVVQMVLSDSRLNLKAEPTSRGSPLHIAAKAGNFKMTNLLLLQAPYLLLSIDAQDKTPLEVATNQKVISLLNRYIESYKGDQVTYQIDDAGRAIDNLQTGGLDYIAEYEDEGDDNVSVSTSLTIKNKQSSP